MTSPIKGTYPRGSDALEEQALRRARWKTRKKPLNTGCSWT